MADAQTPVFGFTEPEVGASRDTWGAKLNGNWALADLLLSMAMPIGAMMDFAGTHAPSGWLLCDGRLISRTTYSALFAVISTFWGSGDGSTTFALPGAPGRSLVGAGTVIDQNGVTVAYSFAQKLGAVSQAIAQVNLPALALTTNTVPAHSHGGATAVGANHTHTVDAQGSHIHSVDVQGAHAHGGSTDAQGGHLHNVNAMYTQAGTGAGGSPPGWSVQTLQTDVQGFHTHNIGTDTQGAHAHNLSAAGVHAHNVSYSGNLQLGINPDGSHAHSLNLGGSGTRMSVLNPLLVATKIIFAGQQAATVLTSEAVPQAPAQLLAAPLRGGM